MAQRAWPEGARARRASKDAARRKVVKSLNRHAVGHFIDGTGDSGAAWMLLQSDSIGNCTELAVASHGVRKLFTVDVIKMSACDELLCRHVVEVTRRREMASASKTRIWWLVRNAGAGKSVAAKAVMVN